MKEGKIEIYLSYKEPEYRDNIMWLRPYLDREGYELLYYGASGWTSFVSSNLIDSDEILTDIPTEDVPEIDNPCECLN